MQISVSNLTFCHEGSFDNVFENVSFSIDSNWKLGLVGRNGRGKTTLLRILLGELEYTGAVHANIRFTYFPLTLPMTGMTSLEAIESVTPDFELWRLEREMSLLSLDEQVLERELSTLSPGQQSKLMLASLFLGSDDFVLIDEPTNHLDALAREAVAEYLQQKTGFILVSHDRSLLDACTDHTLSMGRAGIDVIAGNYTVFEQEMKKRELLERRQDAKLRGEIERLQEAAKRASDWSDKVEKTKYGTYNSGLKVDRGYVGARSAAMMKRSKVTEAHAERAAEEKQKLLKNIESEEELKIHPLSFHSSRLVETEGLTVMYGQTAGCLGVNLRVDRGERVLLSGINGCGKSTVLRVITGDIQDYAGERYVAPGLKISRVNQDTGFLQGGLRDYARSRQIDETLFYTILRKMDFSRIQLEKDMGDYSSGQKKKVLLAASLSESAHLYVWDEPLNFIDILSRVQVEDLILKYCPTLLFVEHDSVFCQKISTREIRLGAR